MKKLYLNNFLFTLLSVCMVLAVTGCGPSREELENNAKAEALNEYVSSLSEDVKISQLFLVNIEGDEKFRAVEKYGDKPLVPGGVLFFGYNVAKSPAQVKYFIEDIHRFYNEQKIVPPYTAIDQEGGDVNRLRKINSFFPGQKDVVSRLSLEEAAVLYDLQAKQMAMLGFNMNLAPVIEVENSENSAFLDTRTFGSMENVLLYGKEQSVNFEKNKVGCVLKHFPGNSATDPHVGLPVIRFNQYQLDEMLKPFFELLPYSSSMLMSHAVVMPENCSSEEAEKYNVPADLSSYWVTEVVRDRLGFEGLVISDDIFMGALARNGFPPEKAVVAAIEAGVDVIMLSEKRFGKVADVLLREASVNPAFDVKINSAVARVIKYKINCGILKYVPVETEDKSCKFKVEIAERNKVFDESNFNGVKAQGQELFR